MRADQTSEGLIQSFTAANTIVANRIVAYGSTSGEVTATTAAGTAVIAGVALNAATAGQKVDVIMRGITRVYAGAAVAIGGTLYTDGTDGYVDDFTPGVTTARYIVGTALEASTADGNLISIHLNPHWGAV